MLTYYNPVEIHYGINIISNIFPILKPLLKNNDNILLLCGKESLRKTGYLDIIFDQLGLLSNVLLYEGVPSNPDITDLYKVLEETRTLNYNCIFAVGGGSVIDMGKALVALRDHRNNDLNDLRDSIRNKTYNCTNTFLVAIPTTSGTGSEVTCWATIWDKELIKKYSIEDRRLFPRLAIVDPDLTRELSIDNTAATALDALCHACEAYWSKNSNKIVRMYAIEAVRRITKNLEALLNDISNLDYRSAISFASLCAGLAFSNTKTTACHSISYPLTMKWKIKHGIAASISLPKVMAYNAELVDMDELIKACGLRYITDIKHFLYRIYSKAGFPLRLRNYGIDKDDLVGIANEAFTPGRMDNNPRPVDEETLMNWLVELY